jgi:hypothetical protein
MEYNRCQNHMRTHIASAKPMLIFYGVRCVPLMGGSAVNEPALADYVRYAEFRR